MRGHAWPLRRATAALGRRVALATAAGLLVAAWPGAADVTRPGAPPPRQGDYRVAAWTIADGLPQNTVTDLVGLESGELWLATFGGLARFDGHGFRVVDMASDDRLPDNRIVSIVPDGPRAFLFLTQQGRVGRLAGGRSVPLLAPPAPDVEALELLRGADGRIFARAADGRAWSAREGGPWQPVALGGDDDAILDFAVEEDGTVRAVRGGALVALSGGTPGERVWLPEPEPVIGRRAGGGVWLGLTGGVARVAGGGIERLTVVPPFDGRVDALTQGEGDTLLVASAGEVSQLVRQRDGTWARTALPIGLPSGAPVRRLHLDGEGSLWIGTAGYGLYRVNRLSTTRFAAAAGLREITALIDDGGGGAFVATGCRRLLHIDARGASRPVVIGMPAREFGTGCDIPLAPLAPGVAWARIGPRLARVTAAPPLAQVVTDDLPAEAGPIVAVPGGGLWAVSRSGRVQRLDAAGRLLREVALRPPLVSASLGPDGALWVGGDGEVTRVDDRGTRGLGAADVVPRGLVRDVLAEADGTVWVATYGGGVSRLRDGRGTRITAAEGLPDNAVSRLLDDGRGRVWVSTNRGLAVVDKAEAQALAEGRVRTLTPVVLGPERGVPEANFGSPAGFAAPDGVLWFGTIEGAVAIPAAAFPFNTTPPAVRFEDVRADDHALPLAGTVAIPALTGRVRLAYTTFALLYPERMRFRFRVEGVDAGWVDAGADRFVDWSPPGPGRYRVLVEARNEDGVWSAAPASVVLAVSPAWWQTTTVRAVAALTLLLAAVAAVQARIRALESRHAARLAAVEAQREADARLASVRAQLEHVSRAALAGELAASLAHEVSQPLGAMVNNAEAGRRHLARYLGDPASLGPIFDDIVADGRRASEVVQGLRGFLQPRGPEAGALDLSALVREMLPLVRREIQDGGIEMHLALAEGLPPIDGLRVQLGQIVVNLVLNACEALARAPGPRRIAVATAARDGRVVLEVSDSGPGFPAAIAPRVFEPFVTTKPGGLGVGLAICRAIAERHGGHLAAADAPGGGVRMTLSLPAAAAGGPRP